MKRLPPHARLVGALLAVVPSVLPGCKCGSDKPFVPYTIDPLDAGGAPSTTAAPSAATSAVPAPSGSAARIPGVVPAPGTTSWEIGGLKLQAPPGRVFSAGVAMADGAVVLLTDGAGQSGELIQHKADGQTPLLKLPSFLPTGPECQLFPRLHGTGRATVVLDVASVCKNADPAAKKHDRYVVAISLAKQHKVELKTLPLGAGSRLDVEVDGADRDGDGQDDVTVQLMLEGAAAGTGPATASLKWTDRDGGFAREPNEPNLSLRLAASWLASQAAKKPDTVRPARQRVLQQMLCGEGAVVVQADGQGFGCGDPAAIEDLVFAEARGHLAKGALPEALFGLTLLRTTRPKSKRVAELDQAFEAAAKPKKVTARPLKAKPVASQVALPIAFEPDGKLSVLTAEGVVSVDPATGDEAAPVAGAPFSPFADLVEGMRVEGATDACKTEPILLRIRGGRELVLPVVGATQPTCSKAVLPTLLGRNDSGLTVLVGGESFEVPADASKATLATWPVGAGGKGSVRSPSGAFSAVAGHDRVLVRGDGRVETWKPTTFFTLNACTAADGGKAVACVLDAGVVLLTP